MCLGSLFSYHTSRLPALWQFCPSEINAKSLVLGGLFQFEIQRTTVFLNFLWWVSIADIIWKINLSMLWLSWGVEGGTSDSQTVPLFPFVFMLLIVFKLTGYPKWWVLLSRKSFPNQSASSQILSIIAREHFQKVLFPRSNISNLNF